jgi:hypothetical protein
MGVEFTVDGIRGIHSMGKMKFELDTLTDDVLPLKLRVRYCELTSNYAGGSWLSLHARNTLLASSC